MSERNSTDSSSTTDDSANSNIGRIEWVDLTVGDAARNKNFYCKVIGWKSTDVEMGTYSDFNLELPGTGKTIAGICHARGMNTGMPAQWLMYVRVADVAASAAEAERQKGKVLDGPRRMGGSNFCVIQDPDGAVMALISD
ncbi:MAG: glyoxalase [Gammaproteobacteria bacterium]|nr:glyoxalase [Gammaproteobacteria bacterium]HBW82550.1 glyoxalase [Gammaproteobacteria bacterium]|tara:strand:- start:1506 stop:1925 length:420 start_codon:yes stop_codon:yes gene_type:complete